MLTNTIEESSVKINECDVLINFHTQEYSATQLKIQEQRDRETYHCIKVELCENLLEIRRNHLEYMTIESAEYEQNKQTFLGQTLIFTLTHSICSMFNVSQCNKVIHFLKKSMTDLEIGFDKNSKD